MYDLIFFSPPSSICGIAFDHDFNIYVLCLNNSMASLVKTYGMAISSLVHYIAHFMQNDSWACLLT